MSEEKDSKIIETAKKVFNWYYIFGEDNDAAKEHLANLGNALQEGGYLRDKGKEGKG